MWFDEKILTIIVFRFQRMHPRCSTVTVSKYWNNNNLQFFTLHDRNPEICAQFFILNTFTTESLVEVMKYSPWPGAISKLVTVLCFPRTMFLISVPSMTSQYESCPSVAKVSIWHSLGWSLAHTKDEVQDNVILFFKLSKLERFRVWLSVTFRK